MRLKKNSTSPLALGRSDPTWWLKSVLHCEPWRAQEEIIEAVRDHARVAVRSAHGVGKSWIAARTILWWLYCFPNSVALSTAPTFRQVRNILWQEIAVAHTAANRRLNAQGKMLGGEIQTTAIRLGPKWYALGLSADKPDAFQGEHAEHVLVVFDEASGIVPGIWDAADGMLTTENCRFLAIGNPTDPAGRFAKECRDQNTRRIKISAFDSPNFSGITQQDIENWDQQQIDQEAFRIKHPHLVSPAWVLDKYRRWGPDSPLYQSRVLAEFPQSASDALILLSWIEAAQRSEMAETEPSELGVDVARFGDDKTVIVWRRGSYAEIYGEYQSQDTMKTCGRIIQALTETHATSVKVDVIGIGAGVVDRLHEQKIPVISINVAEASRDPEKFVNARAEWYWTLRERFERGEIGIKENQELMAQLSALKFEIDSRGRIQIESKVNMRKRGLSSPDLADALMIAFSAPRSSQSTSVRVKNINAGWRGNQFSEWENG